MLLEKLCPQMRGRLVEISDKVRLRDASEGNLAQRANTLARKARAKAALQNADLACVFVHEDLDGADGETYPGIRERVQAALAKELGSAHYVLSVAEVEAWLLLFPDALTKTVTTWKVPQQYRNRDTGTFGDPKEILKRNVSGSARRYVESDAPDVLANAVAMNRLDEPSGSNRSWYQLRTDATECCQQHIPKMRRPQ
ncbi:hypothetical protein [Micromonospora saelicesensis]|uniref:hypothetical protein n=1 Tax=Micromonospora saelicesensis TaxID=285676 RepID=UPI001C65FBCE|nr:hypothetical protein [Micromonospora saelicesensis]